MSRRIVQWTFLYEIEFLSTVLRRCMKYTALHNHLSERSSPGCFTWAAIHTRVVPLWVGKSYVRLGFVSTAASIQVLYGVQSGYSARLRNKVKQARPVSCKDVVWCKIFISYCAILCLMTQDGQQWTTWIAVLSLVLLYRKFGNVWGSIVVMVQIPELSPILSTGSMGWISQRPGLVW